MSDFAYEALLRDAGEQRPRVLVLDAGLATSMRTHLFRAAFPHRYFNLGIAEQNAVGVASGLARRGFVPLLHTFANFVTRRAHDQVALSVAWPRCNVKLIAGSCGLFDGRNGPSHMAIDDLAAMSALPNMMVVEPGDAEQTRALLSLVLDHDGPAYFRLRRNDVPRLIHTEDAARGTLLLRAAEQPRCTLVACGTMLEETLAAHRILASRGVQADLLHVAILQPLDAQPILESVQRSGRIVTVENHVTTGGFGDAIARAIGERGIPHLRLGLPHEFIPAGLPAWQLTYCGLDAAAVAARVTRFGASDV
ncbi:MAG TPA: transketolase C-terminal domain-containing protein [Thermoanaerobaculia bacterium]|nr:transketolase C-terminal domain-containing protein [Thermoanaerobaculia bacterium]